MEAFTSLSTEIEWHVQRLLQTLSRPRADVMIWQAIYGGLAASKYLLAIERASAALGKFDRKLVKGFTRRL